MKEKYKYEYSDPRAMYGTAKVEWDFLEPNNRHEWLAKLPWIGAAALVLLMLL